MDHARQERQHPIQFSRSDQHRQRQESDAGVDLFHGTTKGAEAAPLVLKDTMYVVTPYPNTLYALDLAKPGAPVKWQYEPHPAPASQGVACWDVMNRGAAYFDGKIFYNTLDVHTVAVGAATGKEVWKVSLSDINQGESITMAPIVVKGVVLVGNRGGEFGVRGWMTGLDAKSGKILWRAFGTGLDKDVLIGPNFKPFYADDRGKDLGFTTWQGEQWKIGGASAWGWTSYDPDLDLLLRHLRSESLESRHPSGGQQMGLHDICPAPWAHSRRHLYKALESDYARRGPALLLVAQLYRVEQQARPMTPEDRLHLRQRQSRPILDKLRDYLRQIQGEVLPKSPAGRAVSYTLKNWTALNRYCDDGNLEIDNNATERSIRAVAVGRRNWTFFGSDQGGKTAAVLRSFVASCQRAGVEPFAWFKDVLSRIGSHPINRIAELLPHNWAPAQA